MSRLTLRLPESLHQELINLALIEGVSLNQYIVYALTRQIAAHYTVKATLEKQQDHQKPVKNASPSKIKAILEQPENFDGEAKLKANGIEQICQRIKQKEKMEDNFQGIT